MLSIEKEKTTQNPTSEGFYSAESGAKLCRKHKDPNRKTVFFSSEKPIGFFS